MTHAISPEPDVAAGRRVRRAILWRAAGAAVLAVLALALGAAAPAAAAPPVPPASPAAMPSAHPGALPLLPPAAGRGRGKAPAAVATPGAAKGAPTAAPDSAVVVLSEGFEGGALGASVFSPFATVGSPTPAATPGWVTVAGHANSGAYAAYAPDVDGVADQQLYTINPVSIPTNATAATLNFWHGYILEPGRYDGGVLETSTDNGATWQDVLSTTTFLAGGYTGQVRTASTDPLAGRQAWVESTGGNYDLTSVNLLPFAGHQVSFRFRLGTDDSNTGGPEGWWLDDVAVSIQAPCGLGNWSLQAPALQATVGAASVTLGNAVYTFGGADPTLTHGTIAAAKLDLTTHVWTPIADLPAARFLAGAVSDGMYIYIVGGSDGMADHDTLWRYDPASDSYMTLAPSLLATAAQGTVFLDGKIYRVAGLVSSNSYTSSVEVYTIATNTWSLVAPYPLEVGAPAAAVVGQAIYVGGGLGSQAPTTKVYRYDPATNTWDDAAAADLPVSRYGAGSGVLGNDWIVAGGIANTLDLTSTIGLNLTTNTWESLPPLPRGRYLPGSAAAGAALYLVGGLAVTSQVSDDTQEYLAAPCAQPSPTPTPPASPTPGASPTACAISFSDVHGTDYFYTPVTFLACAGVISGYGDGTFRPFAETTRAQQVKIVVLGFARPIVTPAAGQYTFADVPPAAPFFSLIETAAADGIVSGYACGGPGEPCDGQHRPYFRPNAHVTRGQLSKIDVLAAGWPLRNPATGTFADVAPGSAFYAFAETAVCHGVTSGYACGGPGEPCDSQQRPYFRPGANATRGQIAKIVYLSVTSGAACAP